jgi:hypothetical protein
MRKYILAVSALLFLTAVCNASSGTRGGGNIYAAEFSDIAQKAILKISVLKPVIIEGFEFDAQRMQDTLAKTKIFALKKDLTLDGKSVNAINDPKNLRIEFNQIAWIQLNMEQKKQLVLHELIGLTFPEVSDLNYVYSNSLLQLLYLHAKEDLKIHCRLSARNSSVSEDSAVLDESMSLVQDEKQSTADLADFKIAFYVKDSYMQITLRDKINKTVIDSNQYVGNGIDFETRISYQTNISGKTYDTLDLMCEDALSPAI